MCEISRIQNFSTWSGIKTPHTALRIRTAEKCNKITGILITLPNRGYLLNWKNKNKNRYSLSQVSWIALALFAI